MLMVQMSKEDVDKVFNHLDKRGQGFITYNEFCMLNLDKKRKKNH